MKKKKKRHRGAIDAVHHLVKRIPKRKEKKQREGKFQHNAIKGFPRIGEDNLDSVVLWDTQENE